MLDQNLTVIWLVFEHIPNPYLIIAYLPTYDALKQCWSPMFLSCSGKPDDYVSQPTINDQPEWGAASNRSPRPQPQPCLKVNPSPKKSSGLSSVLAQSFHLKMLPCISTLANKKSGLSSLIIRGLAKWTLPGENGPIYTENFKLRISR